MGTDRIVPKRSQTQEIWKKKANPKNLKQSCSRHLGLLEARKIVSSRVRSKVKWKDEMNEISSNPFITVQSQRIFVFCINFHVFFSVCFKQNDQKKLKFWKKLCFLCSNVFLEIETRRVEDFSKKAKTILTPNYSTKSSTFVWKSVTFSAVVRRRSKFFQKRKTILTPNYST